MNGPVRVMITREGWSYIGMLAFIIAGAVIRDINLLYIMAGMMLGPLLISFYLSTKSLRKVQLTRRFPRLVGMGDPLFVEVIAAKPRHVSPGFAIEARDRVSRVGDRGRVRADSRLFYTYVPSGGEAETSYRVEMQRRGRYQLGPLRVSSSVPLGLIRASTKIPSDDHVLVSPRLGVLLPAWSRRVQLRNEGGQKSVRRRGKAEGDFYGMREFRSGDSRNWIHWRTTAKRNKLTVRQFEQRINQDLVVVLDLWQAKEIPTPAIENAVSFAATLIVEQSRFGSTQLLVASASESEFLVKGTSSPVFRQELMERLAMVETTSSETLPRVLTEVLSQVRGNSRIVLVTTRELDLSDTDHFAEIWRRTEIRRLMADIVKVNTTAADFPHWFHAAQPPVSDSPSGEAYVA